MFSPWSFFVALSHGKDRFDKQKSHRFLEIVNNGFKETLQCHFGVAPVTGSFIHLGEGSFERHADARVPAIQVTILPRVVVLAQG